MEDTEEEAMVDMVDMVDTAGAMVAWKWPV